jgi:DnaJ-class molecular chaperone
MSERAPKQCTTCGGTGWQWLDRSWFPADGMHRVRCHICAGTGQSAYRNLASVVAEQSRRRERVAKALPLTPGATHV